MSKIIPVEDAIALIQDSDVVAVSGYVDLVRHVEAGYYSKVSRYTTNGFMRINTGFSGWNASVQELVFPAPVLP